MSILGTSNHPISCVHPVPICCHHLSWQTGRTRSLWCRCLSTSLASGGACQPMQGKGQAIHQQGVVFLQLTKLCLQKETTDGTSNINKEAHALKSDRGTRNKGKQPWHSL